MNINQVKSAIMFDGYSNEELVSLQEAIKYARAQLVKQVKQAIRVGAMVKFTSSRDGLSYSGIVRKINIKYVIVDTALGGYRVPANMLEVA